MKFPLQKIVSSGSTSVEQAALNAARDRDFLSAGWCPKAKRVDGVLISEEYSLSEAPSDSYELALEWNVRDSDGTLVLRRQKARAAKFAENIAGKHHKPSIVINFHTVKEKAKGFTDNIKELARDECGRVAEWLHKNNIGILNISGPPALENTDLNLFAYWLVWCLLQWNDRIELCLRVPGFVKRLSKSKYASWAVDLDQDTLEGLLWAVGEFGVRLNAMRQPYCDFPDIVLHAVRHDSSEHRSYRLDRIEGASVTKIPFTPRYAVNPHKDKSGYPCASRSGFLVETKY